MQKVFQSVQRVAQKSCGRACEMFCCTSDTLMCEKVPCCTGAYHQPTEDKTTQESRLNPPSTILIVNISNSTLMDCVIGNGTYQSMVADSQPLMRHAGLQMHDQRCSCSRGQQGAEQTSPPLCPPLPTAEPLNVNIQRSNLNCVIIGDNNYMQAEPSTETEEPQE